MDGTSVTIPMYTYKYIKIEHVHQNQVNFSNEVTQINAEDMPLVVSLVTASLRHVLFSPTEPRQAIACRNFIEMHIQCIVKYEKKRKKSKACFFRGLLIRNYHQ